MKVFKRSLIGILAAVVLTVSSTPGWAADNAFRNIFEDALYGGLAGTLVGGALLAFTSKPGNHLDYLSFGAAAGVLAGSAYGVTMSVKSLVAVEDGNLQFALPTIIPELKETGAKGASALVLKAELIRGTF